MTEPFSHQHTDFDSETSLPWVCTLSPIMAPSFSHLEIDRNGSYFYPGIKAVAVFTLCRLELLLSLREIYLEPNRGERQQRRGEPDELLLKSFNENVWGSARYYINTYATLKIECKQGLGASRRLSRYGSHQVLHHHRHRLSILSDRGVANHCRPVRPARSADCDPAICL